MTETLQPFDREILLPQTALDGLAVGRRHDQDDAVAAAQALAGEEADRLDELLLSFVKLDEVVAGDRLDEQVFPHRIGPQVS